MNESDAHGSYTKERFLQTQKTHVLRSTDNSSKIVSKHSVWFKTYSGLHNKGSPVTNVQIFKKQEDLKILKIYVLQNVIKIASCYFHRHFIRKYTLMGRWLAF